MKFNFKIIAFYLLFFIVLYLEEYKFGPFTVGQLWKFPVYMLAMAYVFANFKKLPKLLKILTVLGILLSAKIILNSSFPDNVLQDVPEAFYSITLSLFASFLYLYIKKYPHFNIVKAANYLSVFFIVSNIPYLFFGLKGLVVQDYELARFGIEDFAALKGLFYHVSVTSKILVVSLLIVLFSKDLYRQGYNRVIFYCVILLGLFSIYRCYTRTGWAMLILGTAVLYFYRASFNWKYVKYVMVLVLAGIAAFFYIMEDESLQMRLKGETTYRKNYDMDTNLVSSYRLDIYESVYNSFFSGSNDEIFLGIGKKNAQEDTLRNFGKSMIAHNRFLEIMQYGGVLGLAVFIVYIFVLFKISRLHSRNRSDAVNRIAYAIFVVYIFSLLPSHGFPIWADMLFSCFAAAHICRKPYLRRMAAACCPGHFRNCGEPFKPAYKIS